MSSRQKLHAKERLFSSSGDRIIVALDTPHLQEAARLVDALRGVVGMVKVGLELFVAQGPQAVMDLRRAGMPVFLDLKLHDIPNTVRSAARAAGGLGAGLLTVHATGGAAMVAAAVDGAREGAMAAGLPPPTVLAVTVLTSMNEDTLTKVGLAGPSDEAVVRLSCLACDAGAGGVVCSAEEAASVREAVGQAPLIVTPGVRPAGSPRDDQARVMTPSGAVAAGADYLVIGRPIRNAPDPVEAARAIAEDLSRTSPAI